ncbi:MAG: diacylglycerol kinase family protein [Candidatus Limiplasma sp.]|nr:diacylglycerol kinase family protein [Candidatus Limiplasma sp.]MEA5145709.1 diacylglycerol kinase family protein [Candidatus Limiplasma sp.]
MISVIVNPVAGSGLAQSIGEKVEALLTARGIPHTVHHTERVGHATELARSAAQSGADTVLSVGGDGTLNETAAGLVGTGTALGVIPAGTGNDFVKVIGTPQKWDDALAYVLSHPAHPLDTGTVNDRFFINVCGAGFDVMVLDYANKAKRHVRGIWPYLYGVFAAIRAFRPFEMQVEIGDDIRLSGKYMICTVANGTTIGGGIPILPLARVDDGLLDIMVVDPVPNWRIPFYLPAILGGTLHRKSIAHHYRAAHCALQSHNMRLNMDGELVSLESARFAIKPGSLLAHWPGVQATQP